MTPLDWTALSPLQLLRAYADILEELRRREVVRSSNNPVADYAEDLVSRALGLSRVARSTKGHDAVAPDGRKYEVKALRQNQHNQRTQLSAIRGLPDKHFDFLVAVRFAADFGIERAACIPHGIVAARASYVERTNSWTLHLLDSVWALPGVVDITQQIRQAQS